MSGIRYLCSRKGRFYFRRRVPGLSTCLAPVMVALGTTDRALGFRLCVQLTAQMDLMLDDDFHEALSERDVAAFFKAELGAYLARLRDARMVERMDGSLTAETARQNRLEAFVLRGLVEDGLREEMDAGRLDQLDGQDRPLAQSIQAAKFKEFISPAFNVAVQKRAGIGHGASQLDVLRLRWAAVEARMAAHEAVETVPLHRADAARDTAVSLLGQSLRSAQTLADGPQVTEPRLSAETTALLAQTNQGHQDSKAAPKLQLTEGVALIEGRMTGNAILSQIEAAHRQPHNDGFDGTAGTMVVDKVLGADIAGTAVRMNRRGNAGKDTQDQKLKSVALFMYLTGVQICSEIRQCHIDQFAGLMRDRVPPHYWKAKSEKEMTSVELIEKAKKTGASSGLSSGTIERHLNTITALITHARTEGNIAHFTPNLVGLIPRDVRSSAEKREVFTFEEMRQLFGHTVWQGCKSHGRRHTPGALVLKDHHYWINLLLAYSGARRSEIAGLLNSDVGEEDGIPFVAIHPNHLRGLKNAASKRRLPLHPHLVELGFLDFVERNRKAGKLALFEEAVPAHLRHLAHVRAENMAAFDKKFGDVLDHMLRTSLDRSLDGNPRQLSCHGMRHYVNDFFFNLREADGSTHVVPSIDRLDILGHAPRDENSGTYRRAEKPLAPLYTAIKKLPYLFGDGGA